MGSLFLIGGPMFSGKTSEILRLLFNDAEIGLRVLYVNHKNDTRSSGPFSTHNPLYKEKLSRESKVQFVSAETLRELKVEDFDVIGVDEAQFFLDLKESVLDWVNSKKKKVIVSGLNGDFQRNKFGELLDLIPHADSYLGLKSYCKICASPELQKRCGCSQKGYRIKEALFSHRLVQTTDQVQVGGSETYVPVCRKCYNFLNK